MCVRGWSGRGLRGGGLMGRRSRAREGREWARIAASRERERAEGGAGVIIEIDPRRPPVANQDYARANSLMLMVQFKTRQRLLSPSSFRRRPLDWKAGGGDAAGASFKPPLPISPKKGLPRKRGRGTK